MQSSIKSINEFLSGSVYLIIPLSQREYVWDNEQVITFVNDIKEGKKFLGTLILKQNKEINNRNVNYEVYDGQQRITTLMMIYLALKKTLKDQIKNYKANIDETNKISEWSETIDRRILFNKNKKNLNSILFFDSNERKNDWNNNVNKYLNGLEGKKKRKTKYNNRTKKIYDHLKRHFEDADDFISSFSNFFFNLENSQINDIEIETKDEKDFNIYEIFETLNAKGQKLSLYDLFKNYWFQISQGKVNSDEINEIQKLFKDSTSEQNKFMKLFPIIFNGYSYSPKLLLKTNKEIIRRQTSIKGDKEFLIQTRKIAERFIKFNSDTEQYFRDKFPNLEQIKIEKLVNLTITMKQLKLEKIFLYIFSYLEMSEKEGLKYNFNSFYDLFLFLLMHQIINTVINKRKPSYIDDYFKDAFERTNISQTTSDFPWTTELIINVFNVFNHENNFNLELQKMEYHKDYVVEKLNDYKASALWINLFLQTLKEHFSLREINYKNISKRNKDKEFSFKDIEYNISNNVNRLSREQIYDLDNKLKDKEKIYRFLLDKAKEIVKKLEETQW